MIIITLQEGYIVFRTEHRGNFFATCDFVQFTYKVDKRGYKFKNALIPDIQVAVKGGAVEEPEDVTFQVRETTHVENVTDVTFVKDAFYYLKWRHDEKIYYVSSSRV